MNEASAKGKRRQVRRALGEQTADVLERLAAEVQRLAFHVEQSQLLVQKAELDAREVREAFQRFRTMSRGQRLRWWWHGWDGPRGCASGARR